MLRATGYASGMAITCCLKVSNLPQCHMTQVHFPLQSGTWMLALGFLCSLQTRTRALEDRIRRHPVSLALRASADRSGELPLPLRHWGATVTVLEVHTTFTSSLSKLSLTEMPRCPENMQRGATGWQLRCASTADCVMR